MPAGHWIDQDQAQESKLNQAELCNEVKEEGQYVSENECDHPVSHTHKWEVDFYLTAPLRLWRLGQRLSVYCI